MKHRILITIIVLLSLFLSAMPVRAGARPGEIKKSAPIRATFNGSLAAITNTLPDGHHDNFAGIQSPFFCRAEGWAANPNDRSLHLNVRILSDGVEVAQTIADTFRQDLADAGVCTGGACSFSVSLWSLVSPDADHVITVQAEDAQTGEWSNLYDTPKTLKCFTPQAGTFIVNSTADDMDANPGDGVCEAFNRGECTLRAAITEANANPGMDTIRFNIPGAGPHTISPTYGFDFIFDPVIIDGTTQPGFSGTPIIELDGSSAGPDAYGIVIFAGSSTVRGLAINRFALTGVDININGGNIIQGNYIGTDLTGTVDLGNGVHGIAIKTGSGSNLIGGTTSGTGNLISGNGEDGIVMIDAGTTGNVVQGNFIGTDVNGTTVLANDDKGVAIFTGATNNLIGGTNSQAHNIISGNSNDGVVLYGEGASSNTVQGNYIGTNASGMLALGNTIDGVMIGGGASDNLIGGTTMQARNIIAGNGQNGIGIYDAGTTRNIVRGNFIGTNVNGTLALGNSIDGVNINTSANNVIGGTVAGAGNVISGNDGNGVSVYGGSTGDTVEGNYIGTDVTGTVSLGNAGNGVTIAGGSAGNTIGGTTAGARNIISGSNGSGVVIIDPGSTHNMVQGNYIGTDVSGSVTIANNSNGIGIYTGATNNLIGGTTAAARNIISGNVGEGVTICCDGTTANVVQGNYIGTDVTGTVSLGNSFDGVNIDTSTNNVIGGTSSGAGNLISGNNEFGISIVNPGSSGNLVQGNFIGTDVTGTSSLGNADDGVLLLAPNNTVGGTTTAARNIISGNQEQGIRIAGSEATGNTIEGNFIGTDVTGSVPLSNGTDCCHSGVVIHEGASNNIIGGSVPGAGNVISGNTADGITLIDAGTNGNVVAGNFIGSDLTGTRNIANSWSGITIYDGSGANLIGGTTSGAGNTIAFNHDNGVALSITGGSRNGILSNSIYSNGNLGIDLGQDGVTPNDLFDLDTGPNNLQNSPIITMVKSTSKGTVIQGVLISNVDTTLRLEFFSNNACDTSGYGEGQTYLGEMMVKTNTTGHVNFHATLPVTLTTGNFVTATASDPADNTSEFSRCVRAGA